MNKKTVITIACAFIGILVLLLVVLWLMSIVNHKYYTYEEVEEQMALAADKFYKNNPEILPVSDGRSTLSYNTLVENDYIKPLNELLKDGDSCNAEVGVIKSGNDYTYIPKLSCSDKYSTIELTQFILNNYDVVTEGSGLYSDGNGGYYFKGKINDNYITLGSFIESNKEQTGILWQIVSIDNENRIKMRALYPIGKAFFDTRYNEDRAGNVGYNNYEESLLKDALKALETDDTYLTAQEKERLVKTKLCIGARKQSDTSKDGSTECSVYSQDEMMFGLLYPYEFLRASLDDKCINIFSPSCQNYNFLSGDGFSYNWTVNADPSNNYQVYISDGITYYTSDCNRERSLYVTATLSPYAIFKAGDGTRNNPFRLK